MMTTMNAVLLMTLTLAIMGCGFTLAEALALPGDAPSDAPSDAPTDAPEGDEKSQTVEKQNGTFRIMTHGGFGNIGYHSGSSNQPQHNPYGNEGSTRNCRYWCPAYQVPGHFICCNGDNTRIYQCPDRRQRCPYRFRHSPQYCDPRDQYNLCLSGMLCCPDICLKANVCKPAEQNRSYGK